MAIPQRFIDELVARSDIVDIVSRYVQLKKQGSNHFGLCPFHGEKTASFSVNQDKQIFHCFGCGVGGGVIQFIMQIERLSYPDAIGFLARLAGLTVPEDAEDRAYRQKRETLLKLNVEAARWFRSKLLSPAGESARAYFEKRRLSADTIARFGLGFAPESWDGLLTAMLQKGFKKSQLLEVGLAVDGRQGRVYDRFRNRVMFPIIDVRGDVIGFGGRVMDNSEPKYLNSPETPVFSKGSNLFAMNLAKKDNSRQIILAEGYMDVIALHQAGFSNTVASLGTALTADQARLIRRHAESVTIAYDADGAGQKATARAIEVLKPAGLAVRILKIPGAKDPDEFIREKGPDAFRHLLENTQGDLAFRLSKLQTPETMATPEGKVQYLKDAAELLATVETSVERDVFARKIAEETGTSSEALFQQINAAMKAREKKSRQAVNRDSRAPVRMIQPQNRSLRYNDPQSARAEEGIIITLMTDLTLLRQVRSAGITEEYFTVPTYAKVFQWLSSRYDSGGAATLSSMGDTLNGEEAALLARLLEERPTGSLDQALTDYIQILLSRKTQ
ncbi:MAG: DNA primase, partial [Ruminococcaceae bacterium]|nr:DNA primase [Oscillospiraceae bacterium]